MTKQIWFGVFLCNIAASVAVAQQTSGAQQMSTGQNQSIAAAMVQSVTGAPHQAQKITHSKQILGDGTVITHDTSGIIARDANGRMREDMYLARSGNVNGSEMDKTLQSATVGDPVAHTMLIWTGETSKIAIQMQLPRCRNYR